MSGLFLLAFFAFLVAIILLVILAVIDMRTMLLPNKYVFPFGALGIVFHLLTSFYFLTPADMALGFLAGYGVLWIIRFFGNWYYKTDSLGLGDVKLLGAAGLWLGPVNVTLAMTLGAAGGLLHGIIVAFINKYRTGIFSLRRLKIPAGPGFVFGILVMFFTFIFPEFLK